MTGDDMIEALSTIYGKPTRPAPKASGPSVLGVLDSRDETLATWESVDYSFNLLRSSYQSSFRLVGVATGLDAQARAAITDATRLDALEAPQRELDRVKQVAEADRVAEGKLRLENKARFRP